MQRADQWAARDLISGVEEKATVQQENLELVAKITAGYALQVRELLDAGLGRLAQSSHRPRSKALLSCQPVREETELVYLPGVT